MNPLNNILSVDRVVLDLEATSKKRVFEQAGQLFESHLGIARAQIFDSLFAREKLGSTGIGQGIAIPHGRIKGLKQAAGAFFRLASPVPFDSPDGRPVSLLFVLLVPEQATEEHLQILSELAQRFAERNFRDALMAAGDIEAVLQLFAT
ncbi:MAG: PTS IIA-like nitrogen regulatory protein PtsN [Azonexus sp.]|nr:PTS IIA-like nitrogen regulatory protein PtsN [Azonexus sp.]MCK6411585.1 PTS IIA-like nitrogen regulatory protein PtsN [Azonexus sp.]